MKPRIKHWLVVLIAVSVLLYLLADKPLKAQINTSPPVSDHRFGVVETFHTPELADELNIGWTRIILYWSELKKDGPNSWNSFHAPLSQIDRDIEGGREVVGLIQHTPDYATDGLPGAGMPRGLYLPVDDPDNLWAVFVREVVTAYQGRISHWIIWNEPDIALDTYGALWQGTPADYYQLVKVAYLAAHEVDPNVTIHLGGITYWHNPVFLREFLTAASEDPSARDNDFYFDVVSLHIYFKPESTLQIVSEVRQALADYDIEGKAIWINETNAPPYDDPLQPWVDPPFEVTQEQQASFLLQEFALALALDIERIEVYKWIDEPQPMPGFEPYGLLRNDRSTRPAHEAFRLITTHYAGTQQAQMIQHPAFWEVMLDRGEYTTRVYWSRIENTATINVPALDETAQLISQDGTETQLEAVGGWYTVTLPGADCTPPDVCDIGGKPYLLVEDSALKWEMTAANVAQVAYAQDLSDPLISYMASPGKPQANAIIWIGLLAASAIGIVYTVSKYSPNKKSGV